MLIVDPSASLRARVRELLEEAGAHVDVREAASLSETLDELAGVDAVMLDARHDGLEGLSRARARLPHALLLVLSNHASELHRREYLARGADGVFDKSREFEPAVEAVLTRAA